MLYTGGGVILSDAAPELQRLVQQLGAPCTNTLMGLGAVPASHGQYLGMPRMHGTYEANMAMQHCDVLLAVGARFYDRVIGNSKHFAQNARKIIRIDIDPSSISKRVRVDVPIVGNVKDVLIDLSAQIDAARAETKPASIDKWWQQIEVWHGKECMKYANSDELIKPQFVVEKLWEVTGGDAFVTSDVGQHQVWAAQYYGFNQPRCWINSGGLDTMGVGLPYAMGVQMANPGAEIAVITGEASI
jgi:acetolactate synthase I/II/III large subunit